MRSRNGRLAPALRRKIENLDGLTRLTKLQLDNNVITKIENLEHLTNLTWLDLSFNQITEIRGLDKLTKLQDLSLTHNEIGELENLDSLVNLNVLSIANNKIGRGKPGQPPPEVATGEPMRRHADRNGCPTPRSVPGFTACPPARSRRLSVQFQEPEAA